MEDRLGDGRAFTTDIDEQIENSTRAAFVVPIETDWFDLRHGIAYGLLACSLEYALTGRELPKARVVLLAFAATVGYGLLMEVGQLFRPDRVASMADAASSAVGAGAALVLLSLEKHVPGNPSVPSDG